MISYEKYVQKWLSHGAIPCMFICEICISMWKLIWWGSSLLYCKTVHKDASKRFPLHTHHHLLFVWTLICIMGLTSLLLSGVYNLLFYPPRRGEINLSENNGSIDVLFMDFQDSPVPTCWCWVEYVLGGHYREFSVLGIHFFGDFEVNCVSA